jgi:protein phosphatase
MSQTTIELDPAVVPAPMPPVTVQSFGLTDRGKVRRCNEDQYLIAELGRTLWVWQSSVPQQATHHCRHRAHIFLVADGMGGHRAGEVASALTVTTIEGFVLDLLRRYSNLKATDDQVVLRDFQAALRQADARLFEEAAHHPELTGMGTTLTLAFVSGWTLFVVHAGDSRCYLFHGGCLRQLTADHTMAQELARCGVIRPEEIRHHQYRHVVTNYLGGTQAGVEGEMHKVGLENGDLLLLCSDGLTDMLAPERIAEILAAQSGPEAACRLLVAEANELGGKDNITAVVARFEAV